MEENATPNAMAATEESAPSTEETVVIPETEQPTETQTPEEEGSEPEKSKVVKELIAQRKKRQEAEKEREYWKGVAEGRVSTQPAQQAVAPSVPTKPPTQDDFETWEEYEDARASYILSQAEQRLTEKFENERKQAEEKEVFLKFQSRLNEAAKEDPGILDLVSERDFPVSLPMSQIIMRSDVGLGIIRWIDNNREEAQRIYNLPPILMAKELGAIEAQLKYKPKPTPPKRVSAAPEPIKTITPVGTPVIDENDLPTEEWIRRRNEAQFKRR